MKRKPISFTIIILLLFSASLILYGESAKTTITDMLGRKVEVNFPINRVLSTTPTTTVLVYMIAPEKLIGWNFKPNGKLMSPRYLNLPVVGGWFGKKEGNYETFLNMKPDILLEGFSNLGKINKQRINERQRKMGDIPVIGVKDTADIEGYEGSIAFIGRLLGKRKQAHRLSLFYLNILNMVKNRTKSIPENERTKVYYAEGPNGLFSETSKSVHASLINLCNGDNVVKLDEQFNPTAKKGFGRVKVSLEQILEWNPQVIITMDRNFYRTVYKDPRWRFISAVRNKRVYLAPREPFGWFDRPPGINRIPGIIWTAYKLYPKRFKREETKRLIREFYMQFYHYRLSESECETLLRN